MEYKVTDLMGADLFDLAQDWLDRKEDELYHCPEHRKPRVGCPGCVREREDTKKLKAEARSILPASFLSLLA